MTFITNNNQLITSLTCNILLFINEGTSNYMKDYKTDISLCSVHLHILYHKRIMGYVSCQPAW